MDTGLPTEVLYCLKITIHPTISDPSPVTFQSIEELI
jgi:hypothetical protein